MISAIGTDIVETDRVRKVLSDAFARKVLSAKEFDLFQTMSEERKILFIAGRFAAKEAIIKCLSMYEIPEMNHLEIINDEKGKPKIVYKNYQILLSISHEKHYAIATALLQEEE